MTFTAINYSINVNFLLASRNLRLANYLTQKDREIRINLTPPPLPRTYNIKIFWQYWHKLQQLNHTRININLKNDSRKFKFSAAQ